MFGKKQEKTTALPPPLPPGVIFHVMPGKYQGVKGTFVAPQASYSIATQTPVSPVSGASLGTPSATPIVSSSSKKMLVIWGGIAFVVLGTGGLSIWLLTPKATPPQEPTPVVAEAPQESVPELAPALPTPEGVGTPTPASPGVGTEPTPAPEPVLPPPSMEIISTVDTDQDGLTDVEELLYTTDPARADMDSDGYLDGQEVVNLYNPTGTAPIRIADSSLVQKYTSAAFGYTILYPASWTMRPIDPTNPREVLFTPLEVSPARSAPEGPLGGLPLTGFTASTGEFIEVIVDDNVEGLSAVQWYAKRFPDVKPESLERLFIENLEGVWTKDAMTVYLTKTNAFPGERFLYGITYNYGDLTSVNFRTTLKMMVNSFRVE